MNRYKIRIGECEDTFKLVQEYLFKKGLAWCTKSYRVMNFDMIHRESNHSRVEWIYVDVLDNDFHWQSSQDELDDPDNARRYIETIIDLVPDDLFSI